MKNQRFGCLMALLLPVALELACVERDWSLCSPQDECQKGFTCTADWHCVREADGGADGLGAVDSGSTADAAGGGLDGPAAAADGPAGGAPGPDAGGSPGSALPDAALDTTSGLDGSGGASGSGGGSDAAVDTPGLDGPGGAGGSGGGLDAAATTPGLDGPGSADSSGGRPDAAADVPATPPDAPSLSVLGAPCSAGSDCASGNCADGVCCDRLCGGCNACKNALTGKADGTCSFVGAGQDPHSVCADETTTNPCGNDGTCDGKGSCHYPAAGTACGDPSCTGSTLTTKACDSTHTCVPTSTPCPPPTACDGNTCGSKKAAGAACGTGTECASGKCMDNLDGTSKICCASTCSTCQGCRSDGSACTKKNAGAADSACGTAASCQTGTCNSGGTCQQAAAGTNCGTNLYCTGDGQCTCQAGGSCQPTAVCMQGTYSCSTGTPVCTATVVWGTDHACGPAQSCAGKTKTLVQNCNGSGQCPTPSTETCLYRCNAQATDCDNTNYCQPNPCLHSGTCTDTTTTYTCACTGGWGGANCEIKLFEGLGMLPDPYAVSSYARGVSADGSTVVGEGYGSYEEVSLGFKWTTAGMTDLRYSGNVDTVASAISAFGIVGHNTTDVALVWIGSSDYNLKDLNSYGSQAIAVSDNGVIVGGAFDSNHALGSAVSWAGLGATPVALDTAGSHGRSTSLGVSSDGSVIVGETTDGAFRWTSAGLTVLPGTSSSAKAVSANGNTTVGSSSNSPVRWTGTAGPTSLGTGSGQALAVNSDGTVIVGTTPDGAFLWDTANGRRLLATVLTAAGANLSGWTMDIATGVSSDGKVIVGYGGHLGTTEAWIARLP